MDTIKIVQGYKIHEAEKPLLKDAGAGLSSYRKSIGLTQGDLGAMVGMDKTQICKIESSGNPTVRTLSKVYGALGAKLKLVVDDAADVEPDLYLEDLVETVFSFADKYGLRFSQAFNYLYRFGAIDFYLKDPLLEMELSVSDTIDAMVSVCKRNGGEI